MTRLKCPAGLSGPEGLVIAIINQATVDAMGTGGEANCIDSWAYFGGPAYQNHLAWLGLPNDIRPAAFGQESTLIHVVDLVLRGDHEQETRSERA
jgi:hypothetical protein